MNFGNVSEDKVKGKQNKVENFTKTKMLRLQVADLALNASVENETIKARVISLRSV